METQTVLGYSPRRRVTISPVDIQTQVHWQDLEEGLKEQGIKFVPIAKVKRYKIMVMYDPARVLWNFLYRCKFVKWRETLLRDCPNGYLPEEVYKTLLKVSDTCEKFEYKRVSLEASVMYYPLTLTKIFLIASFSFDENLCIRRCVCSWDADMDLLNALSS